MDQHRVSYTNDLYVYCVTKYLGMSVSGTLRTVFQVQKRPVGVLDGKQWCQKYPDSISVNVVRTGTKIVT